MNETIRFVKIRRRYLLIQLICRRILVFGLWSLVLFAVGCAPTTLPTTQVSAVQAAGGAARAGFARVTAPREFVFPRDHGPHQEYAIEWWYYTGNLDAGPGRHFG